MAEKNNGIQLTEGSRYRIYSIGGRDEPMETKGVFHGFSSFGIDEGGIIIELDGNHGDLQGIFRIVPLHAILAIDILDEKPHEKKDDEKESAHFYG